jgi:hypothetical protein
MFQVIFHQNGQFQNLEFLKLQIKIFCHFKVIESEWDGYPLVNAIGAGAEIGNSDDRDFGAIRYLLPNEVEEVLNGLRKLSKSGFQKRYRRESAKEKPCPWIDCDCSEDEINWRIDYYNKIVAYYQDAVTQQRAMLLYLT